MSHANKCILRGPCTLADTPNCNAICASYIALHGYSGNGGRVGSAAIPADYRNLTLATSPVTAADVDVRVGRDKAKLNVILREYVATYPRQFEDDAERIKSLYLYSESPGTGKTTTAAALANEYQIVHYIGSLRRNRQASERPVYFLDVNAWQKLFLGFNRSNVPQATAEPLAAEYYRQETFAKTSPFVVMDDIGVRSASEAFRSDLHGIINYRVTNGLTTVYTSNIPMSELMSLYDVRLADRVRDMCVEITFEGESKRGIRKK